MLTSVQPSIHSDYLKDPKHSKILIAVSGGSDSLALLQLCFESGKFQIYAATVDHGLRAEAAEEAKTVQYFCENLKIPHNTLKWQPSSTSSQSSRLARYALLVEHAQEIGAEAILLGHTLDDQAETLLMRAQRIQTNSGTRGLSGMTEISSYGKIKLVRPLLATKREALRHYLKSKEIVWVDDPSNEKLTSERVRTRINLRDNTSLPSSDSIAKLAAVSARHRLWLNQATARIILNQVTIADHELLLRVVPNTPSALLSNVFATLILVAGGQPYRLPDFKLSGLVYGFQRGRRTRINIGRCIVSLQGDQVTLSRENRNLPQFPKAVQTGQTYDGRWKFNADGTWHPTITALEHFRPHVDDCLHDAVMQVLTKEPHST